jgi:outer membrane protein assembly factor BamB
MNVEIAAVGIRKARPLRAALAAAAMALVLAASCPAVGQGRKPLSSELAGEQDAGGDRVVEFDASCADALNEALRRVRQGEYDSAVDLFRALLEERRASALVAVPGDGRRFLSLSALVNALMADLPDEAMALYRSQCDPLARALLAQGIAQQDPSKLRRVARTYLHSSVGPEALRTLALMHWDRGRFVRAARGLREALRHDPPGGQRALLLAQESAAWHLAGRPAEAAEALAALKQRHADAEAVLGGQRRRLVAFVEGLHKLPVEAADRTRRLRDRWPGLGGLGDGLATMCPVEAVLAECWRHPGRRRPAPGDEPRLCVAPKEYRMDGTGGRNRWQGRIRLDRGRLLMRYRAHVSSRRWGKWTEEAGSGTLPGYLHPVVVNGMVLYRDRQGIKALDARTGRLVGKVDAPLYSASPHGRDARSYRGWRDRGRYMLTVGGGRVYALANFTPQSKRVQRRFGVGGGRWRTVKRVEENPGHGSEIIALDVSAGLKRLEDWGPTGGEDAPEALWGLTYLSPPCYRDGRLYAAALWNVRFNVVCFRAESGELIWRRGIAYPEKWGRPREEADLEAGSPPAVGGGRVFAANNAGVVAALDAESGRVIWVYRYDSERDRRRGLTPRRGAAAVRPRWPANPVILTPRYVVCLPADSEHVLVLDRLDGSMVRKLPRAGQNHLSALDRDRFVLSRPGLHVVDLHGQNAVHTDLDDTFGRPAVSAERICVCAPGRVYTLDLASGRLSAQDMSDRDDEAGLLGNLVVAGGRILAANAAGVSAYAGYDLTRRQFDRRIEKASGGERVGLLYRRGRYAQYAGLSGEALRDYRAVRDAIERGAAGHGVDVKALRDRMHRLLLAGANQRTDRLDEARAYLEEASAVADSPRQKAYTRLCLAKLQRLRCQRLLARSEELRRQGRQEQADELRDQAVRLASKVVGQARQLAAEHPDLKVADLSIGPAARGYWSLSAEDEVYPTREWAGAFVGELLEQFGRAAYRQLDAAAREALRRARAEDDIEALVAVADTWPNSRWADDALLAAAGGAYRRAARNEQVAGELLDRAVGLLTRLMLSRADPNARLGAAVGLAMICRRRGWPTFAQDFAARARTLAADQAGRFEDRRTDFGGREGRLSELLAGLGAGPARAAPRPLGRIAPPLRPVFSIDGKARGWRHGRGFLLVRGQDRRPVRVGRRVLGLWGRRAVLVDPAAPNTEQAVSWTAEAGVSPHKLFKMPHRSTQVLIGGVSLDGNVIVLAGPREARGFRVEDGGIAWRCPYDKLGVSPDRRGKRAIGVGGSVLVVVGDKGEVAAVRLTDGTALWHAAVPEFGYRSRQRFGRPVVFAPGAVLVRTNNGKSLVCWSAETGRPLASWNAQEHADVTVSEGGGLVVAVDGTVAVHDPADPCDPIWRKAFPAPEGFTGPRRLDVIAAGRCHLAIAEPGPGHVVRVLSILTGEELCTLNVASAPPGGGWAAYGGRFADDKLHVQVDLRRWGSSALGGRYVTSTGRISDLAVQCWRLGSVAECEWAHQVAQRFAWLRALPLEIGRDHLVVSGHHWTVRHRKPHYETGPHYLRHEVPAEVLSRQDGQRVARFDLSVGAEGIERIESDFRGRLLGTPVIADGRLIVGTLDGMTVYGPR